MSDRAPSPQRHRLSRYARVMRTQARRTRASRQIVSPARSVSRGRRSSPLAGVSPEELVGHEWADWYRLTPAERWLESEKLWQIYLSWERPLDPEPDTHSPFFDAGAPGPRPPHGRTGVRVLRRGGV